MKRFLISYFPTISIAILVILYSLGLVGLHSSSRDWFLAATPITLLLSTLLLLLNHRGWNPHFVLSVMLCFGGGFFLEVLGVESGFIFGHYWYGFTLGMQLWGVPIVIGLNWLLLTYCAASLIFAGNLPKLVQIGLGASLMTILDVLIEPIAMQLGFWQWEGSQVPIQNYVAWFIFSCCFLTVFRYLRVQTRNPISAAVIALQFCFFGILNLTS